MNRVELEGRLGADPETKTVGDGTSVTRLRMATNESWKDNSGQWQEKTDWHTVVCWRKQSDRAAILRKGDPVLVIGRLETRKWQDKEGNERHTTEVVARSIYPIIPYEPAASGTPTGDDDLPF